MNCPNCNTPIEFPDNYKPLSAWAYFGLTLLFSVPIVGFIFLIIFSISKGNIHRRSFARSYWCSLIIVGVLVAVIAALVFGAGLTMSDLMYL